MRLFVALDLDDGMRRRIARLVKALDARLGTSAPGIAWIPHERLHLTVQFIGHVDTGRAADVQRLLSPPFAVSPFTLHVRGLGAFPAAGRPRVVWIGLARGREEASEVHAETARRLETVDFRRESRPFAPHLTIGRWRQPGPARVRRVLAEETADAGRCTIDHVTLYESRLSPRGPTYVPLLRSPLTPPGG
jgi:2'-5' RNA ligase